MVTHKTSLLRAERVTVESSATVKMLLPSLVLAVITVSQLPLSSGHTNTGPASGWVLDLVLILDFTTYSPVDTTDEVAAVKTFANALLQELAMDIGEKATRVGVIKYGRVATTVLRLTDSYDAPAIQNTISGTGIEHAIRWGSNMGLAIKMAVTEFTLRARPVSTTARKAVIISTYPPSDTAQQHEEQIAHAESSNVTLYAVGIGPFVGADTLRRIAQNDSTRVYLAASVNASLDLIEDLARALLPDTVCKCRGEKGDRGEKGEQGIKGPSGTLGRSGAKGEKGDRGVDGTSGQKGKDGKDGEKGYQGAVGPRGPSGQKGSRGTTGGVGPRGQKGERGYTGATGYGQKGQKGQSGIKGARGYPGPQEGGSVYTRWGRTVCPSVSGTEKVYDGYAAGTRSRTRGGGSNIICLTKSPRHASTYSAGGYSYLGAVEYEGETVFRSRVQHNAPCAVCTTTRNRQLMIPGTTQCPSGWTHEYWGYLTNEHDSLHRTEFLCFDSSPQSIPGSEADQQSSPEVWTVEANCDVLCPPYQAGKEITCVVCTK